MNKSVINLKRYQDRMATLVNFYRYAITALSNKDAKVEFVKAEIENVTNWATSYLKDSSAKGVEDFRNKFETAMPEALKLAVKEGSQLFRYQVVESAFSIFELFLNHLVYIYYDYFPPFLKNPAHKLDYVEIIDNSQYILDYIKKREIERFSRKSLKDKKQYLEKKLKLTDPSIWVNKDLEMWEEIDDLRQKIVHFEPLPLINENKMLLIVWYLESVMLKLAALSQADHGIPFEWFPGFSDHIKMNPPLQYKK